ncbi:unnamed protein product [Heligmosomoides polygyrus]|uniref:Phorbol-ester/DAG-type domain-containing protein n=1 Tax=Heligmosomoides polygyrus TaxID=6339 RepID=A0A183GJ22_HELPZ|nr:unnamed protein product [Heligmosomoides polygyrus]
MGTDVLELRQTSRHVVCLCANVFSKELNCSKYGFEVEVNFNIFHSERHLENADQVVLVHGAIVRCVFYGEKGRHHPDNCPYVRTVEARQKICLRCLGFYNTNYCQTECSYCRSTRHNAAVCLLPEERQKIAAKIGELSSSDAEYRDERDGRREPGKTAARGSLI